MLDGVSRSREGDLVERETPSSIRGVEHQHNFSSNRYLQCDKVEFDTFENPVPIHPRLAEVFPTYLVASNYGYLEYADCHPHAASENVANLPTDEICAPPNQPNRKLWTGFEATAEGAAVWKILHTAHLYTSAAR